MHGLVCALCADTGNCRRALQLAWGIVSLAENEISDLVDDNLTPAGLALVRDAVCTYKRVAVANAAALATVLLLATTHHLGR